MAASAMQLEANRANAQLSTGPRSESGKQASSRNAEKHNLTGGEAFVEGENWDEYITHCKKYDRQFKPVAEHEMFLVKEMSVAAWRLMRARRMENEVLEKSVNPYLEEDERLAIQLQRLIRYIAALERTYYKAYHELKKIHDECAKMSGRRYDIHGNYQRDPLDPPELSPQPPAQPLVQPPAPPVQNEAKARGLASLQFMLGEYQRSQGKGVQNEPICRERRSA